MSYSLNKNDQIATFQFEISDDNFQHELEKEIFKNKDKMNLSVYRDGKIPADVMHNMYDQKELVKQTMNSVIGAEYNKALDETGLIPITPPTIKVQMCQKGQPFQFTVETYYKPEIQLGTYTGIEVAPMDLTVPEDTMDQVLKKLQQQFAVTKEVTDRPAQLGDLVHIDFEGFLHGRTFKGNKADNFPLTLGSQSFIPGFEEQVVGVGINEAKDFTVTYPEKFKIENLAGQDVVFRCIVRRITSIELPEITDEFIKAHTKFNSVDEYKTNTLKLLAAQKQMIELRTRENKVLKGIVDPCEINIADVVYAQEETRLKNEQMAQLQAKKIPFEKHLKMIGMTKEVYEQQMHQLAITRIRTRLVLLQIAQNEGLMVDEAELQEEFERLAKAANRSVDEFTNPLGRRQIRVELTIKKASTFIMTHLVEVPAKEA